MGFEPDSFLNVDDIAREFLEEWRNNKDYVVAHTSGSTGRPKLIRLLKSDMIASAEATIKYFGIRRDDYLLCPLSCHYIAGKMMAVRGIVSGAIVDFNKNLNSLSDRRIKLMSVVPAQIDKVLSSGSSVSNIENLLVGGSPLSAELEECVINSGISTFVSYGMTETCSHVAIRRCGEDVYHALPGISFSVDSEQRLIISSSKMSFGTLLTNDVVSIVDNHSFRWIGRFDNAIISGGVKVFAEEIEKKIRRLIPADVTFYVTSLPDRKWGEMVVVVADKMFNISREDLAILPPAERPKKILIRPIGRTESGKIKRTLIADTNVGKNI